MIEVIVIARHNQAEDICSFELARADGAPLPAFTAGAHIDVHLPGGLVRQYSLCNHPDENHRYLIGVLKDPASRGGSQTMHVQIQVGQTLSISEPRNLFPLTEDARRSLLFAGGIGITPMLCMAERLHQLGADFELHYCARSVERAAFLDRLRAAPFADRVQLHFDDGAAAQRLDASALLAEPGADTHLYVCGPGGFMAHVLDTAKAQGWADERAHREYFAAAPVDHAHDGSFAVQLASSGQIIQIPADQSVAEALDAAGILIPLSCEQGICGTCLTGVLAGEPEHRDLYLSEEEQARNDQFTPCCSRAKSPLLVLDL
ncbi:PDR/VanB family oxidoreductase [Pseudomonas sp. KSR10]|uniref:Vanillate O-demethylase oxidoreductase n=1 Tax=Stutzerimonas stutzeri TaxID=316 RepID=A0A0D9AL59_STUST|nr:PDR/VanB family oxidoreductase [Stutzerimonas stutzeri]KJH80126.1 Vanillate O-demethylase oxidoreductase [Stutzerimonas stutzeri]MCG6539896.1 PDR/VanB family oxidoreductase [Pseudomonas sp. KSR10]